MLRSIYSAIFGLAAVSATHAHHSIAGMYDRNEQITVTGVIVEFRFIQPHSFLILDAGPGKTEPKRWHLEMDNHFELVQIGITADTFRPGDEVVVTGDSARNGTDRLYLRRLDRPADGLRYEQPGFRPSISASPRAAAR